MAIRSAYREPRSNIFSPRSHNVGAHRLASDHPRQKDINCTK